MRLELRLGVFGVKRKGMKREWRRTGMALKGRGIIKEEKREEGRERGRREKRKRERERIKKNKNIDRFFFLFFPAGIPSH